MTTKPWSGNEVRRARAIVRPSVMRGVAVCPRCGRPVRHDPLKRAGGWHADHYPIPREHGGPTTLDNLRAAHDTCNTRAGGKRGAAITNAKRAAARATTPRGRRPAPATRNMRGV